MHDKLRSVLDGLERHELLALRESVQDSPAGSTHEIQGHRVPKEQAIQLINQALPVEDE